MTEPALGSRDPNSVVFAVSEFGVLFNEFARLFRDKLQCRNALFLDGGSATSFYSRVLGRNSNFLPLGPIIGVYGLHRYTSPICFTRFAGNGVVRRASALLAKGTLEPRMP